MGVVCNRLLVYNESSWLSGKEEVELISFFPPTTVHHSPSGSSGQSGAVLYNIVENLRNVFYVFMCQKKKSWFEEVLPKFLLLMSVYVIIVIIIIIIIIIIKGIVVDIIFMRWMHWNDAHGIIITSVFLLPRFLPSWGTYEVSLRNFVTKFCCECKHIFESRVEITGSHLWCFVWTCLQLNARQSTHQSSCHQLIIFYNDQFLNIFFKK